MSIKLSKIMCNLNNPDEKKDPDLPSKKYKAGPQPNPIGSVIGATMANKLAKIIGSSIEEDEKTLATVENKAGKKGLGSIISRTMARQLNQASSEGK